MTPLFAKLNLKDQATLHVLNAPVSFDAELGALEGVEVKTTLAGKGALQFCLAFVTQKAQIAALAGKLVPRLEGDALLWFAYPKGSSKNYRCDFNRDNGWDALGAAGFEPVRMVAIDADWSALRFRRTEFIKTMHRDPARRLSAAGKARAGKA